MPPAPRAERSGGVHFLAAPRIAARLVRSCPLHPGDLVVEFGAGQGAITTHLAETNAHVLAVERDPEFVRKLRSRLADRGNVRVIQADIMSFPLPRKHFSVVASIPYALSTALLRRLLSPQRTRLRQAALIVEWGFAKRVIAPRHLEQAWWAARFELELVSRISANCFSPPPRVDSAHLVIRRRQAVPDRALWTLLSTAYRTPSQPARKVLGHPKLLHSTGIDPAAPVAKIRPAAWAELARHLARDRSRYWPPLPPRFR
ncbi:MULTISPECIES: ribosomal RNA small subunit methyltransferase A [Amycolatopsis]|uniref:Ribosomal RNA adenine methylase transferase N-terminal domain-containing protein n=1 Tax=Amycolatopsis dongchuanensis TaxID=1070866 RepID=A0ABP9PWJ9_9PSEU